ncbi:4-amino-4-deoxy-L-arabinose-phosphoundecaprenol flippase subunit ArnF [Pantoea sp. 1.19]|uniref:4-amino-4-deoxy-L-arabinose-phosphoundecaprenol flippase subunit ArnF n=1 Tax=Pantoea sp. 1.19 TaxID=1925589 RepID=UPI000948A71F|nr:4-amino-4-deoxy-L-arabinose-phosphoundecaprenol flippase subunit ArnF [Pantoea sp. 1.19]
MKGGAWAAASVLLVSVAQLLLRGAMQALPPAERPSLLLGALQGQPTLALALLAGLLAYGCSMLCWFLALRQLPLSRAYPLLSLSYVLVWAAATLLPGMQEPFHWLKLAGVVLIVSGLLVIWWPTRR